jgi:serine/threonine protein kinase
MSNKTEIWKKASEVYAEISELSPKQALSHLYDIQNITPEVREAIITLINTGSQASQYFADEISPNYHVAINNNQNFKAGQILDEYKLLEELGHGGMSQVFKAERINTDQQTFVAIKVFAPRDNSQELLNHFINEQKILSGLSHPHIVKMLHGGTTNDETAYLVMELIEEALPLDRYSAKNKLSIRKKIKLISQCADALAYSHANLIIHRDLKPDNILINQNNELKIVDFGIAKLINNDISGHKTTLIALTPSYAAPEQINSQSITVKTDVFSLAVVALDLLIEKNPLPKDRLVKSCANDEAYLDEIFKSLKCDKDIKNVLRKALEQEPNKRYSSMQSFADDLNNYLANKPVNATSQSLIYRIQKFAKRRAALFATMLSFMIFLLIGSLLGYQQYKQIKIEAEKANQVKQFMLDAYSQTNPDYAKGNVITAEDILNSTAKKLEGSQLDQEIKSELLQTIGIAYGQIGQAQKGADFLKKSLAINPYESKSLAYQAQFLLNAENWHELNSLLDNITVDSIHSNSDKAKIYRVLAKTQAKESNFDQATITLNKAIALNIKNKDKNEELLSQKLMAEFLFLQSKPEEGIVLLQKLLKDPSLDQTSSLGLGLRADLSVLYTDIGELDKAYSNWNNLIKDQRQILGDTHPEVAKSLLQISGVLRYQGDLVQAMNYINEAHNINLKIFGKNHILTAASFNSLAVAFYQTGDYPKAIEHMYKAVNIFEDKQSPDYADTLELKTNLAALLLVTKRYLEAEKIASEVYNIQLGKLGETHDSTIYSQQTFAKALAFLNKLEKAQKLAESALDNSIKHLGDKNPLTTGAYFTVAQIYSKQNKFEQSLEKYNTIIKKELIAENNPNYPRLMHGFADIYTKMNNFELAETYHIKALEASKNIFGEEHRITKNAQSKYAEFLAFKK